VCDSKIFHSFIHQFNNTAYASHLSELDKEIKVGDGNSKQRKP